MYIIVGGNGTIGTQLIVKLIKSNLASDICIADKNKENEELDKILYSLNSKHKVVNISHQIEDIRNVIKQHNPKHIIHLGENLYNDFQMDGNIFQDNLVYTAQLFRMLHEFNISCIVGNWNIDFSKYKHNTVLTHSLQWKRSLVDVYNVGNIAITDVQFGYLTDFKMANSLFGSLLSRIMMSINFKMPLVFFENEYNESVVSWNTVSDIVDCIIDRTKIRSRKVVTPNNGIYTTIKDIIETYLFVVDIGSIIGYINNGKEEIEFKANKSKLELVVSTIERAINEY